VLDALAWPVVGLVLGLTCIFVFRAQVGRFLDRTKSVGKDRLREAHIDGARRRFEYGQLSWNRLARMTPDVGPSKTVHLAKQPFFEFFDALAVRRVHDMCVDVECRRDERFICASPSPPLRRRHAASVNGHGPQKKIESILRREGRDARVMAAA
jgi:hypothetical protein